MFKKLCAIVILMLCSFAVNAQQFNYKLESEVNLQDGYTAKLVTREDSVRVILVMFPKIIPIQSSELEAFVATGLLKLYGTDEFIDAKVEAVGEKEDATLIITTYTKEFHIRLLVNNLQELKVIGMEIKPQRLPIVPTPA
jgi:hypothetical protein